MITHSTSRLFAIGALAAFAAGCATTPSERDVHRFDPLPRVDVGAIDLDPVESMRITDMLLDAERAFKAANTAQENGDFREATTQYTKMLELLIQADVDPAIFYNLRREFAQILDTTTLQATVYDHGQPRRWAIDDFRRMAVVGDLEIPDPLPQEVQDQIVRIQTGYPQQFQRGLNRSVRYLPYIHHEFAKAGVPLDVAWLAIVESNFWSDATSRAGAGGMWQFMRATGQQYNLEASSELDERYNWEMATRAAARHLTDLYNTFGSWPLAITAYNSGTYNVQRRMALNGNDTDVFRLMSTPPASNAFPQETKEYYPKLLASIIVASDPEKYGFTISPDLPDPYQRIPVRGSLSLAALNNELGLPAGTLEGLNPELRQKRTPSRGDYPLAVPVGKGEVLVAAAEKLRGSSPAPGVVTASAPSSSTGSSSGRTVSHTVRRGETLSGIATRYRTTQQAIMSNNRIASPERIRVGQRLTIPVSGDAPAAQTASTSSSGGSSRAATYTVRRGDSLSGVAQRHGVTTRQIQRWNDMGNSTRILVGQTLKVAPDASPAAATAQVVTASTASSSSSASGNGSVTHVVKRGEAPSTIAQQYGVSTANLLAWNNLNQRSTIQVGQELTVRNPSRGSSGNGSSAPERTVHKVQSGENPWIIASRYGVSVDDFLKWNNLSNNSVVRTGQELVVYPGQGGGGSSSSGPSKVTHTVKSGENPTTIARSHGVSLEDLFTWNSWQRAPVLRVGDTITLYR